MSSVLDRGFDHCCLWFPEDLFSKSRSLALFFVLIISLGLEFLVFDSNSSTYSCFAKLQLYDLTKAYFFLIVLAQ